MHAVLLDEFRRVDLLTTALYGAHQTCVVPAITQKLPRVSNPAVTFPELDVTVLPARGSVAGFVGVALRHPKES